MQHRRGKMWGCRQRKQRGVNEEPRKSGGLGAGGVFGRLEVRDNTQTLLVGPGRASQHTEQKRRTV